MQAEAVKCLNRTDRFVLKARIDYLKLTACEISELLGVENEREVQEVLLGVRGIANEALSTLVQKLGLEEQGISALTSH